MQRNKEADDPKLKKLEDQKHRQEVKLGQVDGEFKEKEEALYADMQGLVEDIQPIQLHVLRFYDFMRSLNDGIVKAFPQDAFRQIGASEGVSSGTKPSAHFHGTHVRGAAASDHATATAVPANKAAVAHGDADAVVHPPQPATRAAAAPPTQVPVQAPPLQKVA